MDELPTFREDPQFFTDKALEFCTTLKDEDNWYLVNDKYDDKSLIPMIRNERCECPISSLVLPEHPELLLGTAFAHAHVLGLEEDTTTIIVVCSDGCTQHSHFVQEVRDLLESLVQDRTIQKIKIKPKTIKGEKWRFKTLDF